MGEWIPLTTAAGPVRAWLARPERPPLGAVIVIQEIFGVNPHIRRVTDQFADAGFTAMAPALFDPVQPDVQLGYDDAGVSRGRDHAASLGFERALQIVSASARWLRESGHVVGVIDLTGLLPAGLVKDPNDDVLNGIAWDDKNRRLFVTGKNWPSLFEIRLTGPR